MESPAPVVTFEIAKEFGEQLGLSWKSFGVGQFRKGMEVELEHGKRHELTNVTNDDMLMTAKIALAHLNEYPDYYDRLQIMEQEAEGFWNEQVSTVDPELF